MRLFLCFALIVFGPLLNAQEEGGDVSAGTVREVYISSFSTFPYTRVHLVTRPMVGNTVNVGYAYLESNTAAEVIGILKDLDRAGLPMDVTVSASSTIQAIRVGNTASTRTPTNDEMRQVVVEGLRWDRSGERTLYLSTRDLQSVSVGRISVHGSTTFLMALHAMAASKALSISTEDDRVRLRINP